MAKLSKLTDFLDRLDEADVHYTLTSSHEATVTVSVTLDDAHYKIDFESDGDIEVEVFKSDGEIQDFSAVEDLFERVEA